MNQQFFHYPEKILLLHLNDIPDLIIIIMNRDKIPTGESSRVKFLPLICNSDL